MYINLSVNVLSLRSLVLNTTQEHSNIVTYKINTLLCPIPGFKVFLRDSVTPRFKSFRLNPNRNYSKIKEL